MNRTVGAMALAAAMSGCVSTEQGGGQAYMSQAFNNPAQSQNSQNGIHTGAYQARPMPGFQGPDGQQVPMTGAAAAGPQSEADAAARATLAKALPPEVFQQVVAKGSQNSGLIQCSGTCSSGGCPTGGMPGMGMPGMGMPGPGMGMPGMGMPGSGGPGMGMPGMGMPGPGMPGMGGMPGGCPPGGGMPGGPGMMGPPGAVAAVGALTGGAAPFQVQRTEVRFVSPASMKVSWFVAGANGKNAPSAQYLETPGRYNFLQAAIYRLKLSDIPNRPGVELYPTLEVVPAGARAQAFLAHSSVPVSFTEEDLEQVASGNFVVKVIYLPDPQFQDLASTGPDEVVSSRLEPGQDPIAEAHRRGSILLVVRLGNIDLEAPNTPSMDAPSANQKSMPPGGMMPGMMPPSMLAGSTPPYMPKGMPPGMMPPGMGPNGMMPPGMGPRGMMPPGMMPPGMAPSRPNMPSAKGPANGMPMGPTVPLQIPPDMPSPTNPAGPAVPGKPVSQAPIIDPSVVPTAQTVDAKPAPDPAKKKSLLDFFSRSN